MMFIHISELIQVFRGFKVAASLKVGLQARRHGADEGFPQLQGHGFIEASHRQPNSHRRCQVFHGFTAVASLKLDLNYVTLKGRHVFSTVS